MGEEVSWLWEVAIKPGELENLRTLMGEMVEATQDEPGALIYEWFVSNDGDKVAIYERYADSAATMAHLATFGGQFAGRFLSIVDPGEFQVFGSPSDEVREAFSRSGASYLGPFGGFSR